MAIMIPCRPQAGPTKVPPAGSDSESESSFAQAGPTKVPDPPGSRRAGGESLTRKSSLRDSVTQ
jgi:hypothetical protein